MSNVVSLGKLVVRRIGKNWYEGKIHGRVWFRRSRSEVFLAHRRWALQTKAAQAAIAQYEQVARIYHRA